MAYKCPALSLPVPTCAKVGLQSCTVPASNFSRRLSSTHFVLIALACSAQESVSAVACVENSGRGPRLGQVLLQPGDLVRRPVANIRHFDPCDDVVRRSASNFP